MTQFQGANDWSAGANNLASKDRLPKAAVRHAVNVDITERRENNEDFVYGWFLSRVVI